MDDVLSTRMASQRCEKLLNFLVERVKACLLSTDEPESYYSPTLKPILSRKTEIYNKFFAIEIQN